MPTIISPGPYPAHGRYVTSEAEIHMMLGEQGPVEYTRLLCIFLNYRMELHPDPDEDDLSEFEFSIGRDLVSHPRISEMWMSRAELPPAAPSRRPWWRRFLDRFGAES